MSKSFARVLAGMARFGTLWMSPARRRLTLARLAEQLTQTVDFTTPYGPVAFVASAARALRAAEPDTLRWIDGHAPGETLWDIGANIGFYSLYAAQRGLAVLAFEPGAASFAALTRHIELNRTEDRISAYCLAFAGETRLDRLAMANTGPGHSLHAFGSDVSVKGPVAVAFRQAAIGFTIDDFRRTFDLPPPRHIKLDVDGIEAQILCAAQATLREVRSVLVEIDGINRDAGGTDIRRQLEAAGLVEDPAYVDPASRNRVFRRPSG